MSNSYFFHAASPSKYLRSIVAHSPHVDELISSPNLVGTAYTSRLGHAVSDVLRALKQSEHFRVLNENPIDVINILRGGLSFGVPRAVEESLRKPPMVSFISSQRAIKDHEVLITETSYEKWRLQNEAYLIMGDIAATGSTLTRVLERAFEHHRIQGTTPSGVLIFTIGSTRVLNSLSEFVHRAREFEKVHNVQFTVVFLGQMFRLYEDNISSPVRSLFDRNSDFMRGHVPIARDALKTFLRNPLLAMEKCAIYDGGMRAFEGVSHYNVVLSHWKRIANVDREILLDHIIRSASDLGNYDLPFNEWITKNPWLSQENRSDQEEIFELGRGALSQLRHADTHGIIHKKIRFYEELLSC